MERKLTKGAIGKEITSFSYRINREKVKEFLAAINEKNPLYTDIDYAKKFGYTDTPLPPTANTMIVFWGNPNFYYDMESIGINKERFLHYKEEYSNYLTLYPDSSVSVKTVISDIKLGKMDMVIADTSFFNEKDELCILVKSTIVIRPEK
jgi:hypothetical protein